MPSVNVCGRPARAAFSPQFLQFFILTLTLLMLSGISVKAQTTFNVPAGGDFQQALNAAQYGDEIVLAAGASYVGTFTLPYKPADPSGRFITVRGSASPAQLPAAGTRVSPSHAPLLPKLLAPGQGQSALRTLAGAHHFRFIGIEFATRDFSTAAYELVTLGDYGAAQDSAEEIPHHLVFDRCYLHALDNQSLKRGISLNSASTDIVNSYLSGFKVVGQEAQAILGWNGPGPFRIVNNYLEAAGENLMFGGSSASVPGLVPSDIEVRGNHLSKPLAWREGEPEYAGVRWEVKNLFELKSARRVVVEGNLFEYSWRDAQVGFAILLTPLDQNGTAPWAVVEDVLITNNIIRHAASGIQIKLYVSPARRITIRNNLFEDIDGRKWCGTDCSSGHFLEVEGAEQLTVEHNTVLHTGNVLSANGRPSTGFSFSNNLAAHNAYGIFGSGQLPGTGTLATYFPNAVLSRNVIASANSNYYPANNYYPGQLDDVLFVSRANGNYRLADNSPYKNAGTDGKDVGCDFAALNAAMGNTSPSTTPTPTPTPMPTPAPPNPTPTPISNTPAPGVLQDVIWTSLLNANAAGGGSISHNGAGYFAKGQSQQTLSGAGYFEWRHNGVYCTVGFGNNNDESPSANHTDLEFTLHSDATSYSVREFGTYRSHGPLAAGDVLRIEVSATGDILYKKNGTTVHSTSNPAKAYPYYLVFKTQETVGNGITSAKVVSLTPAPIPTPIPTPTPVTGQPVSHGMVAAAHTLATALGAASSVSSAEIESLERKIEPAYAAYLLEAKQFASTERIDSALRVSLYFARAAKALSAAGAGSASVQNRLQIAASRLGQALNFMHPAMPGAQGENAHAPAANTMPFVGAANTYSSAAMSPLLSPLSLGTITGDAARSPLALTSVLADQGGNKPLLYELAGASVSINGQAAPLLYVSPSRISFLVPRGLPQGEWEVLVTSQDGYVSRGTVVVNAVVPALFTADGSGAGQALSMNNSEPGAIHYDVTSPHALGADKRTRVTLFATGIGVGASNTDFANDVRMGHGGTMANVAESLTVEARTGDGRLYHLPVEFAGALEGRVPGLDQVNVVLYPELRGAGSVDLTIIINGRRSNTASINVR